MFFHENFRVARTDKKQAINHHFLNLSKSDSNLITRHDETRDLLSFIDYRSINAYEILFIIKRQNLGYKYALLYRAEISRTDQILAKVMRRQSAVLIVSILVVRKRLPD